MSTQHKRILIAEDNPGLARVLSFKFKSGGFEPITCLNGGEAWKAFESQDVLAVVSDHEMPIMSGIELIGRIREVDRNVPCFMVTGRQLELSGDPIIKSLGITDVFAKPFSPATVVAAVALEIKNRAQSSDQSSESGSANTPVPTINPTNLGQTPGAPVS